MSAIVSAVVGVISDVADIAVGAIEDVAEFAIEEIVEPVAEVVTDTIEKAIEDPIGTIAMAASIAYPPMAPLIMGANTLAHGGSLEDAFTHAALAYAGGQLAQGISGGASTALVDAGMDAATATTVGNIAGNVASTTVRGGDPLTALISGGVGAGVGELTSQIEGFSTLDPSVQRAVRTVMSAELTGRDPTQSLVNQAFNLGIDTARNYTPTTDYNYDPATNPADPNADSNPDLNGTVADNIPAGNLPATDYTFRPDYGLSNGVNSTSGLTPPTSPDALNPDGSANYDLADPTVSEGLTRPVAPTLSEMGGGYGLITPVTGGYMTSLGFVPEGSSSVLGDPASFINDPNVLGTTVIGENTLRAPLTGVTSGGSSSSSGGGSNVSIATGSGSGSGGLPSTGSASSSKGALPSTPSAESGLGMYKTAGGPKVESSQEKLDQLKSDFDSDAGVQYEYIKDPVTGMIDFSKMQNLFSPTPYAQGGAVQYFADGDQPVDQSSATTSADPAAFQAMVDRIIMERTGKGPYSDVMTSLKKLGELGSDIKPVQHNLRRVEQGGNQSYAPRVLPQLSALLRARGMTLADGGQPSDAHHPNYDGTPVFRTGGLEGLGGKYVEGKGDGTSDDISAMLANGEYVFSADVVSALGNGSNKAGADRLSEMVEAIRARARSAPPDKLPPDAKSPLEYLKSSKGKKHD